LGNDLHFRGAWSACLELAVFALKDEPMRTRVAHVAYPFHQSGLRLDELEGVVAISAVEGHCCGFGDVCLG